MATPKLNSGRIPITLAGKDHYLEPSLEACLEISQTAGGIQGAVQRLHQLNFETICAVIGAGIRINGQALNGRQREELLPKSIYEAGLIGIAAIAIDFCHVVANGGRLPSDDEGEDDDDQDGEDGDESPLESATESST